MMTDLEAGKKFLQGVPSPVLVAVSGGLDSMCLLHLLSTWGREQGMEVSAAHFNHQLRGEAADRDEAFVRKICGEWKIPFVSGTGNTRALAEAEGLTIEEAARELRYAFLERVRQEGGYDMILTAHHADDNAETMLLNLLRGTGLRGLTGIPDVRGCIARPFLQVTRAELEAYASAYHIPYVEDETNALDEASRNVLRHKVLPVLKGLNPRAVENMARAAELLTQDEAALELAAGRLMHAAKIVPGVRTELPHEACEGQPAAVLSRVVWGLMCSVSGHQKDLTAAHVAAVVKLLRSAPGREVSLPYGMTARLQGDTLLIRKLEPLPEPAAIVPGEAVRFGTWTVCLSKTPGDGVAYGIRPVEGLTVTCWRPADRLHVPGSRGHRTLKRLCVERGIQPWQRDGLPVLRMGERPVAVPGIGVDTDFAPQSGDAVMYVTFYKDRGEGT